MTAAISQPRFIVVEGTDGTGKSTVARGLAQGLDAELLATPQAELRPVRQTADRLFTPDSVSRTLFYAATVVAASEAAARLLAEGRSVVMDRYWLTTLAYARVRGRPLGGVDALAAQLRAPDTTLFLTAPRRVRLRRLSGRGSLSEHDRFSSEKQQGQALERAYRDLSGHHLAGRFVAVDASSTRKCVLDRAPAEVRR